MSEQSSQAVTSHPIYWQLHSNKHNLKINSCLCDFPCLVFILLVSIKFEPWLRKRQNAWGDWVRRFFFILFYIPFVDIHCRFRIDDVFVLSWLGSQTKVKTNLVMNFHMNNDEEVERYVSVKPNKLICIRFRQLKKIFLYALS